MPPRISGRLFGLLQLIRVQFRPYNLLSPQYSLHGLYLYSLLYPYSLNVCSLHPYLHLYSLLHPIAFYQPINGREYAISRRI
jgi:hypothetical protein